MTALAQRDSEKVYDEIIDVPLPDTTHAKATVRVGRFPRRGEMLPGWYAEAKTTFKTAQAGPCRERGQAIAAAVDGLANRLIDHSDACGQRTRMYLKPLIAALTTWAKLVAKQANKENAVVVTSTSQKILSSKECKTLLEDFRRSYSSCTHAFVELGEKAAAIRDQEAFSCRQAGGETCATFDQWIRNERFGHSFVYSCMKAARIYRLMAPIAEPRKIVLDCESHFRSFPKDTTPKQAEAIADELIEIVEPREDGSRWPTRREVNAALAAVVGSRSSEVRGQKPDVIDVPADLRPPTAHLPSPRLPPETIDGEYPEVVDVGSQEDEEDDTPMVNIGVQDWWAIRFALAPAAPETNRTISGFATCLRQAVQFDAFSGPENRKELARLFRTIADELDPLRRAQ